MPGSRAGLAATRPFRPRVASWPPAWHIAGDRPTLEDTRRWRGALRLSPLPWPS